MILRWGTQRQRRGQVWGRFPEERQNRSSKRPTWDPRWPRSTICQWDTIESRPTPARTLRNRTLVAATVCQCRWCRKRLRYPATRGRSWIPTPCWCSDRWRHGAERSRWSVYVCRPTETNWNLLMCSRVVPSEPIPTSPGSWRWWPGWWSGGSWMDPERPILPSWGAEWRAPAWTCQGKLRHWMRDWQDGPGMEQRCRRTVWERQLELCRLVNSCTS